MATDEQIATIQARRIDETAREMMRGGVSLTWDEAEIVGDEACAWIAHRLGLTKTTDEAGVHFAIASGVTWHEQLKAAAQRLYGGDCGADLDAVDLDDYRGMAPEAAIEAIVRDARARRADK